jgi:hypothetical protein
VLLLFSCKKEKEDNAAYLNSFTGKYTGSSHYSISYPKDSTMFTLTMDRTVLIDVKRSVKERCLDFNISRSDTSFIAFENVPTNEQGEAYVLSGTTPSSFGSLEVNFLGDSLQILQVQKCGIPCGYFEEFKTKRE